MKQTIEKEFSDATGTIKTKVRVEWEDGDVKERIRAARILEEICKNLKQSY